MSGLEATENHVDGGAQWKLLCRHADMQHARWHARARTPMPTPTRTSTHTPTRPRVHVCMRARAHTRTEATARQGTPLSTCQALTPSTPGRPASRSRSVASAPRPAAARSVTNQSATWTYESTIAPACRSVVQRYVLRHLRHGMHPGRRAAVQRSHGVVGLRHAHRRPRNDTPAADSYRRLMPNHAHREPCTHTRAHARKWARAHTAGG